MIKYLLTIVVTAFLTFGITVTYYQKSFKVTDPSTNPSASFMITINYDKNSPDEGRAYHFKSKLQDNNGYSIFTFKSLEEAQKFTDAMNKEGEQLFDKFCADSNPNACK